MPPESEYWKGFYISLVSAWEFPYANGKEAIKYFYKVRLHNQPLLECMDRSAIVRLRSHNRIKIFWLIPVTNETGSERWFHLYLNSVWRNAAGEFMDKLITVSESIKEGSRMMSA